MLDAIDIDAIEQAVYEVLLDGQPRTIAQLRALLDLHEDQVRHAATQLVTRGLLNRQPGRPPRFTMVSPDIALGEVVAERERALQRTKEYAEQLISRFHTAATARDPAELVEIVTGRSAVRQRLRQMQYSARDQIRAVDRPPYAFQPHENNATELELLAAGIRYRVIYDTAGLEEFHDLTASIETGVHAGEEARVMTGSPTKLIIIDDRAALLPLQPAPDSTPGVVIIRPSALLEALVALFEHLWRQALPLQFSEPDLGLPQLNQPSPDELRLISMLAAGLPDATISKKLGISHRTYQRRLHNLFERLGAQTRFQAGIQATRRGWITG